jgi:hypothetical protein
MAASFWRVSVMIFLEASIAFSSGPAGGAGFFSPAGAEAVSG